MGQNFDLFGDPIPDNWGRRGRPQHIPTAENINKISMGVALGWNNERIANALDITLPTLRKHYFSLIKRLRDTARDRLDLAYAMKLWAQVQEGNVGAMRLWKDFADRNDAMVGHNAFYAGQRAQAEEQPKAPKLGKKEEQALAAESAGENTDWGSDLRPPMN